MHKTQNEILEAGLKGEEVTLKGIIVPGELDAFYNFKMISILLSTDHELDFEIVRNAKGEELFEHLRESIRVKGFIREDEKGRRTIQVSEYDLLERVAKGMKAIKPKIRDR